MKQKITGIELFSGIGAQKEGINLTKLFDCDILATSDIDKDAMLSYAAIHNNLIKEDTINNQIEFPNEEEMRNDLISKNIGYDFKKKTQSMLRVKGDKLKLYWLAMTLSKNMGDISKIKLLPFADFWTYSFPCQDISVTGKQAGIKEGTRSGLLFEVERLLEVAKDNNTQPKFLLLENVKNLVGQNHKSDFEEWIRKLDKLGYNTYWKVLKANLCGIPQLRERVLLYLLEKISTQDIISQLSMIVD